MPHSVFLFISYALNWFTLFGDCMAKQLPSSEGVISLDTDKREIIAASYGYDSDGRYTVNKAYSVEGKFLRIVGDKERE